MIGLLFSLLLLGVFCHNSTLVEQPYKPTPYNIKIPFGFPNKLNIPADNSTLRNVELTGPYMRDGRFKTLEQVIDFYSSGLHNSKYVNPLMHHINDGGVLLTPNDKKDLLSFIKSLWDDSFLTNPDFSRPDKFPDQK